MVIPINCEMYNLQLERQNEGEHDQYSTHTNSSQSEKQSKIDTRTRVALFSSLPFENKYNIFSIPLISKCTRYDTNFHITVYCETGISLHP